MTNPSIAVLLPCYNEEITIGKVIDDFRRVLPTADIYVYDNNSSDHTAEIAREHGAIVRTERRQGKGNVVRSMFSDIEADYYIMADGDDTYPAEFAPKLLEPVMRGEANFAIGDRLSNGTYVDENKRRFHNFGNVFVRNLINKIYDGNVQDIMTGYRAFDWFFVKTMPVLSSGFEIETEMTIHALENRFLIKEIEIDYRDRPEGSESKLNTFSDGIKVIRTIMKLLKHGKPLFFFGVIALVFALVGLGFGVPVIVEFLRTHFVSRVPTAILATGLMLLAMMFLVCGFILDTMVHKYKQLYTLRLVEIKSSSPARTAVRNQALELHAVSEEEMMEELLGVKQ